MLSSKQDINNNGIDFDTEINQPIKKHKINLDLPLLYYKTKPSKTNKEDENNEDNISLSSVFIPKEIAIKYNRLIFKKNFSENNECPVCMNSMFNKVIGYTPCSHIICRKCLIMQLEKSCSNYKYKCPMCRNDLTTHMYSIENYNRIEKLKYNLLSNQLPLVC